MATSIFDKNIVLGKEAAERLADIMKRPAPPRPNLGDNFWEKNEREVKEWLSLLRK